MASTPRTVMITGAAGATGAQLAGDLAAEGANLALVGRDRHKLDSLAARLNLPQGRVITLRADLRDGRAAAEVAQATANHFGRLDALVHLVGGWTGGKTLVELPPGDLEDMLAQHAWSTFNAIQACVPLMARGGWGRVIVVSSPSAVAPGGFGGAYAAAKAAQESLILSLAKELRGSGVTANIIQVSTIDTRGEKAAHPGPENTGLTTPAELSSAIRYLLSDAGGALNGARLPMFGA